MLKKTTFAFLFFSITILVGIAGCAGAGTRDADKQPGDSTGKTVDLADTLNTAPAVRQETVRRSINTKNIHPDSILAFARTLIGIPYLYASSDPAKGFDCSGFITYVFNHFNIAVPRSSVDFTDLGKEVDIVDAKPGDLILFTGTDSTIRIVGHMGIVENTRDNKLYFIHSTSGKEKKGVVITPFENYYHSRFVKIIRVFPGEYFE